MRRVRRERGSAEHRAVAPREPADQAADRDVREGPRERPLAKHLGGLDVGIQDDAAGIEPRRQQPARPSRASARPPSPRGRSPGSRSAQPEPGALVDEEESEGDHEAPHTGAGGNATPQAFRLSFAGPRTVTSLERVERPALLDGDGLRQVARLVDVQPLQPRDPVREQLERQDRAAPPAGTRASSGRR